MLTSTFVSLSTRTDAWAIALGAGDYEFTTGALSGGTFTIDGSGAFSAWNILFPGTSISQPHLFQDPTPPNQGGAPENQFNNFAVAFNGIGYFASTQESTDEFKYIWAIVKGKQLISQGDGELRPVPEPSTLLLSVSGLLGLAGYRWHQRRRERTQVG